MIIGGPLGWSGVAAAGGRVLGDGGGWGVATGVTVRWRVVAAAAPPMSIMTTISRITTATTIPDTFTQRGTPVGSRESG